jgi:hypothetical protein
MIDMKNSGLYMIVFLSIFTVTSVLAQQNPYEDNISKILSSKKENQPVMLTAMVSKWIDDKTFVADDKTGSINISFDATERPDLIAGDEISLSGKVKLNGKGEKEILMNSFRKLKFIKNPANCCRPEVD